MKIITSILALVVSAACVHGFDVSRAVRTSSNQKVDAYSDADRMWRQPDPSKIRHSDGPAEHMGPEDRTWGQAKDNQILRKSENSGSFMHPEDRKWRLPNPDMVLTDSSMRQKDYTDAERLGWTTPDYNKLRHEDSKPGSDNWRLSP